MGRAPCCDKANVKKGPWSPEEDATLKSYIEEKGTGGNWIALPQKIGLKRCGKSCRLRWLNYLRPNIKHGGFSEEEDNIICNLYISIGSRWSIIAAQLPGRTDNDIKNYWNTRLKKKLLGKQRKEQNQSRRGGKFSEMKKGIRESSISVNGNQNPYWPDLPVLPPGPYSNPEPCFNDHNSIRKLLIKLGGRFSDDYSNHDPINGITNPSQFPIDASTVVPPYEPSISNISASSLPNDQYTAILPGESGNFTANQLEEMVYNGNNPQRLHGMEFLYEEEMVKIQRSGSSSGVDQSMNWGEMSSLICPTTTVTCSNYNGLQQGIMQDCGYDQELNYHGLK